MHKLHFLVTGLKALALPSIFQFMLKFLLLSCSYPYIIHRWEVWLNVLVLDLQNCVGGHENVFLMCFVLNLCTFACLSCHSQLLRHRSPNSLSDSIQGDRDRLLLHNFIQNHLIFPPLIADFFNYVLILLALYFPYTVLLEKVELLIQKLLCWIKLN